MSHSTPKRPSRGQEKGVSPEAKKGRVMAEQKAKQYRTALAPVGFAMPGTADVRPGPELKYADSGSAAGTDLQVSGATMQNLTLNGVAEGDDINQRTGRQVEWKSLLFRFRVVPAASVTPVGLLRLALVWDGFTNGGSPALSQALVWATTTTTSPNNLDNRARFKILRDWIVPMGRYDTAGGPDKGVCWDQSVFFDECFKRFNEGDKAITIYNGTGGATANIQNGGIYLLAYSDAGCVYNIQWSCRLRFTDM